MIINLRGTSGSGKSYIVREVMSRYAEREAAYETSRKRPLGYRCARPDGRALWVIGHYETPCGGCDTLGTNGMMERVYSMVDAHDDAGEDVLYEGLIVESDVKRCATRHAQGRPLLVIALDTPIDVCLASVQDRRTQRGDERQLNPANTVNRVPQVIARMKKLVDAGVDARWLNRADALRTCLEALQLAPEKEPAVEECADVFQLRP